MKIFSLKKYDNFIISTFKSRKAQYFFLNLPVKLILIGFMIFIALCTGTKLISIGFVLAMAGIVYLIKKQNN